MRLKGPPPQGIRKGGTIRSSGGNDLGQKPGKVRSRPHIVSTLLLGAAGILPGGCCRQAPLPFDEALREKVFFGYQVLIQVSRTRGTPRLFFRCSTLNKSFVQVNDSAHAALFSYGVGAFDFIQAIWEKGKENTKFKGASQRYFRIKHRQSVKGCARREDGQLRSAVIAATALIAFTLGACRELAPSKQESTTYEPSLVCKLLILGCRVLIPDRLLAGNRPRLHRGAGRGLRANKFFLLPCGGLCVFAPQR